MTEDEGAATPQPPSPPPAAPVPLPPLSEQQERNIAMLMHLTGLLGYIAFAVGFAIPLVIWLTQKDRSAFVERQGYVMFNAWISYTIYSIPAIALSFFCIGLPLLLRSGSSPSWRRSCGAGGVSGRDAGVPAGDPVPAGRLVPFKSLRGGIVCPAVAGIAQLAEFLIRKLLGLERDGPHHSVKRGQEPLLLPHREPVGGC